jgi:hypothetical protein
MRAFAAGDRITHKQYGDGTVTSVNEFHTKIDFDEHGPRTFVSSRVDLTPAASAAPVKAKTSRKKKATT